MENRQIVIKLEGQQAFAAIARTGSGDAALLYAFAAARGGRCSLQDAVDGKLMPLQRASTAADLLTVYGLIHGEKLPPPRGEHDYNPGELVLARKGDPAFNGLCDYMEAAAGRMLSIQALRTLYGVYDMLSLPADVLVLLINYCKNNDKLSVRELEKQAYRWHDAGINTYEKAERYLEENKQRRSRMYGILRSMGIHRDPSPTESKYLQQWMADGFSDELVALAYDKTVMRLGKVQWGYMNSILQSWRKQNLTTPQQVETQDTPAAVKPVKKQPPATVEAAVLQQFEQKRKQREKLLQQRLEELRGLSPEFMQNESSLRLCASRSARAAGAQKEALQREYSRLCARREEILQSLGKPADWLSDKPDCSLCGDRGYIGTTPCRCFTEACRVEQQRRKATT